MGEIIINGKLEDALIGTAVDSYLVEVGRKAMAELGDGPLMKMPGLVVKGIHKAERKAKKRTSAYRTRRRIVAAIVTLVLGVGLITSYTQVEAFRLTVKNFLYQVSEDIGKTITQNEGAAPLNSNTRFLEYIPSGFERTSVKIINNKTRMDYEKNDKIISFTQEKVDNATIAALVGDEEPNLTINGATAIISDVGNGEIKIVWYTEKEYFALFTNLAKDEAIKMAESVNIS